MLTQYDALICGGGLAGLTLARQLRQEFPDMRVGVVEKETRPLPEAAHKVGESTVELGSQYLERLGLRHYLREHHLIKFGLRFFPGGGHLPVDQRVEIGPINQPVIASYQIDRGRFESDLRGMTGADAIDLHEGWMVRDIELGANDAPHRVTIHQGEESRVLEARWLVDSTGRAGLLRGRLKLKRGGKHEANAGWFRVQGRVDITKMASPERSRWFGVPEAERRWLSTNHLMGVGYWVWIIPLASGATSIGVVTHNHVHGFERVRTLEAVQAFLAEHEPLLYEYLQSEDILDFRCLKNYCHTVSRCWHPDRWALVGEAGAFSDPLYSPGTDYIALANSFTTELIRADRRGQDLLPRSQELNAQYRALVNGSIGVYRNSASVYGHPRAMATKIFWDNHVYWSFPCQFYQQNIYQLSGGSLMPFSEVGARFVELSNRMQSVLRYWAEHSVQEDLPSKGGEGELVVLPAFPSMLVDSHCALGRSMSPEETLGYMTEQLNLGEELFSEILLRVTMELGPIVGRRMWDELEAKSWELRLPATRISAEALEGRQRRRALPEVARDVERALGAPYALWSVGEIAAWLGRSEAEVA